MARKVSALHALSLTIKQNKVFFIGYILVLIIGFSILPFLGNGEENLFFVHFRKTFWDTIAIYTTQLAEPIVLSILIIFQLFKNYRKSLSLLSSIAVMLVVMVVAKSYFKHNRPALFFKNLDRSDELVAVVGTAVLVGENSFPSGHTMGAFTVYTLFALYSKQKSYLAVLFLLLAIGVAWSRIYLGHHFLKDVIAGSIFGVVIALISYFLFEKLKHRPNWNKGIAHLIKKNRSVKA